MTENKITIVITSYKSDKKILSCLESIDRQYKVIIIENSKDQSFKDKIEKQFANVECVVAGENLGYAKGNNLGLSKVKTKHALILNPDAILQKKTIENFFIAANKIKTFAIIAPAIQESNAESKIKSLTEVESVKGFAMFMNLEEFKSIGFFDKNFFIYMEEIDLCKRLVNKNKRIFLDPEIIVKHQGGSSHDEEYNLEMELSRNWHWMWSSFYFSKKYNGYIFALLSFSKKLISSLFKSFFYFITMNKEKRMIYFFRLSGLFNSIIGKTSWYRPFNNN
jgi:N-acetylglucosaminyl-diphospho-decaprenol L-rhamnosyltransferase|tara:strand:+ start:151 stop:987 length:837 start_codon:yes stop_codon:yes gene_type:complete